MVDLQRVVAVVQSVRNAPDMDVASVPIIALLEEKQEALAEAGRLAIEVRTSKMCYDDQFKTGLMLEDQRDDLYALVKRIISDRGCTCNKPDHRCGTNQMHEDAEAIVNSRPTES